MNTGAINGELLDLKQTLQHVYGRLRQRLDGMDDREFAWLPTSDRCIGLAWRLKHLRDTLAAPRNGAWLGGASAINIADGGLATPADAASALHSLDTAFEEFLDLVSSLDAGALDAEIGAVAGKFGAATKRSYVLHVLDELTHHAAECGLLRDLYAWQASGQLERQFS